MPTIETVDRLILIKVVGWGDDLQGKLHIITQKDIDQQSSSSGYPIKVGANVSFRHPQGGWSMGFVLHIFGEAMSLEVGAQLEIANKIK